jgi:hypothetical protein
MSVRVFETSTPLVIALAGEPDRSGHEEAVRLAEEIAASYNPETQMSTVPAYAGTRGTVCYKGTGTVIWPDSRYPTDDA